MVCASQRLPITQQWLYHDPPEVDGIEMEFRLIYRGQLPSESGTKTRPKVKNDIRRAFHTQLAELWKQEMVDGSAMKFTENPAVPSARTIQDIAENHKIANRNNDIYRFVPLIGERHAISCALDILFMRRDKPGGLIKHGGDIDNRLKVLFDSLRMPHTTEELPDTTPGIGEDPFFCLMQDDKFVTSVNVTTDRLLIPLDSGERIHDVELVIGVKTVVFNPMYAPFKFW